ncbi:MAG: tetratricopeptide repeat protein [Candidatus Limivivens sp.]|nr:tetratricopeptide repeat protein [Candidatus Limivivens sp.]
MDERMKEGKEIEKKNLEWRKNQIQLRKSYADTPAGFQNEEAENTARSQLQSDWEVWKEKQHHGLLSEYHPEEEIFVGRERELEQISNTMEEKKRPVILYGIGGIGKSALAREWIRRNQDGYRHILELKFGQSFTETICSDEILPIANLKYRKEQYGSEKRYFRIKKNLLEECVKKEKTLILVDGCNVVLDRYREKVFSLPCDFLVTTRIDPVLWDGSDGIYVGALEQEEEWKAFAQAYAGVMEEETYREFLAQRDSFQGHTLRMILQIRKNRGEPVEEEIQSFEESLLMRLPLKQKEKKALCCLSLMPDQRIGREMFQKVTGCQDQVLLRLQRYQLVSTRLEKGEEELLLHPVAAEVMGRLLPPNAVSCGRMIRGFAAEFRGRIWHRPAEENQYLEPYALAILQAFPGPAAYLAEPFGDICRFIRSQGWVKESEGYFLRIYDSAKAYFGEQHQVTGQVALQIGEFFYEDGEGEQARIWYREALRILESSRPKNRSFYQSLSLVCCRIAREMRQEKKSTEAELWLRKACAYLRRYRVPPEDTDFFFQVRQAITLEKAWLLAQAGRGKEAVQLCEEWIADGKQRFCGDTWLKECREMLEEVRTSPPEP